MKRAGVGAHEQLAQGANLCSTETKYKRSKNVFTVTSIALKLGHIWAQLLQLLAKSFGSPVTILYTQSVVKRKTLWTLKSTNCAISDAMGQATSSRLGAAKSSKPEPHHSILKTGNFEEGAESLKVYFCNSKPSGMNCPLLVVVL